MCGVEASRERSGYFTESLYFYFTFTLLAGRALYHVVAAGDKMNLARKYDEPANFLNDVQIKRRAGWDSPLCASALVLNLYNGTLNRYCRPSSDCWRSLSATAGCVLSTA